jgi:4-amino-4-deoxy-L-arabinose transferase-like glycosyltransferase
LQYLHYGEQFLGISLGKQTFNRIWEPVSNVSNPPWYYLLEIAKYTLPWLIFLPKGIRLAWKNHRLSWGKLALVWSGVYLLAISLMMTKLPWYIIPIYPGLSLLIGASLAAAWRKEKYPQSWQLSLSLIAMICWVASAYYGFSGLISVEQDIDLGLVLGVLAISLTIATLLIWLSCRHFIPVIIIGFYLALLLLFNSSHWLWELAEAFPVQPIASIIKQHTPDRAIIYTSYPSLRPALEFYSDRVILPTSEQELKQHWQESKPVYLLVDQDVIARLNLNPYRTLGEDLNDVTWQLITQAN